ncbi:unnamed protein product, partial [Ectocarpus fasciculatus]
CCVNCLFDLNPSRVSQDTSGTCQGLTCTRCGVTSLSDRSACVTCGTTTIGLVSDSASPYHNDCGCAAVVASVFERLVETDTTGEALGAKECVQCAAGTAVIFADTTIAGVAYKKNLYSCQSCPDPLMSFEYSQSTYSCVCPAGYTLTGQAAIGPLSCVDTALSETYRAVEVETSQMAFSEETVLSLTVQHYFVAAATACLHHGSALDSVACQTLANLCVLQSYNLISGTCAVYLDILNTRASARVHSVTNWVEGMPWLVYDSDGLCDDKSIRMKMSLNERLLRYVVSTYTLNGTWLGYRDIGALFNYCTRRAPKSSSGGGPGSDTGWQIFGAYQQDELDCDLDSLLEEEQLFYELFLLDVKTDKYYPVPVRHEYLRSTSGSRPNAEAATARPTTDVLCSSGNVFTRRFALFNILSGITTDSITINDKLAPKYVHFANYIKVEVSIRKGDPERILSPVLTLGFSESNVADWGDDHAKSAEYVFIGSYTMDIDEFEESLFAANIAAVILFGLMFFARWFNWRRRVNRPFGVGNMPSVDAGGSLPTLDESVDIFLLMVHSSVVVGCPALTLVTWYWFVFFKMQDTVAYMLPPQQGYYQEVSPYFRFMLVLHLLAMFQLVYVIRMTFKQANADIFFLDWEPAGKSGNKKKGGRDGGVSVWRTILVANEWNELAAMRRTDIRFTLFWVTFFLLGLDLEYSATQQPDLDDKSEGNLNIVLRFANTTWWLFFFTVLQWLWKFLIYERFISEPPEQVFVDMCTLAKVSLLLLDEPYHGYYLHCRSPHQFADGTMEELVEMLHKEEEGMTTDRSMEGAPEDVQCFEMFLTTEWRMRFNQLYFAMIATPTASENMRQGAGARRGGLFAGRSKHNPRVLVAWHDLTFFLQEFFDNNFSKAELKRIVNEPTYVEKLLKRPPDMALSGNPSVFRPDRRYEFTKLLFLGREWDLLMLDILVFGICDLWFDSTAASILLVYLTGWALGELRAYLGQNALSRKTLVDERFLI